MTLPRITRWLGTLRLTAFATLLLFNGLTDRPVQASGPAEDGTSASDSEVSDSGASGSDDGNPKAPVLRDDTDRSRNQAKAKSSRSPKAVGRRDQRPQTVKRADTKPRDFRSRNFIIHTDLSPDEAEELLDRLESLLRPVSKYFGRANREPIECYVVRDLSVWPDSALHPIGREKIAQQSGVTITVTQVNRRTNEALAARAVVYAFAKPEIVQHESIHAYCGQNFGRTGPTWYSEGMAEMGQYWRDEPPSEKAFNKVNCVPEAVSYLRSAERRPLNEIVAEDEVSGDSWQNYCWRWALCHLLSKNPNYYDRFRPLGLAMLQNHQNASFENVYGTMQQEIDFEYQFFLKHFDLGYDVTLTRWDWKAKFRKPAGDSLISSTIQAQRGWQPSRVTLEKGKRYEVRLEGNWKLSESGPDLDAKGQEITLPETPAKEQAKAEDESETTEVRSVVSYESRFPPGTLVGTLFNDYELSESFVVEAGSSWTSPGDGDLFVRCEEAWNQLGDNRGRIILRVRKEQTRSAVKPPE
ncbi:MAG: hypothetical protein ACK526_07625 [Planctomyces sp.]